MLMIIWFLRLWEISFRTHDWPKWRVYTRDVQYRFCETGFWWLHEPVPRFYQNWGFLRKQNMENFNNLFDIHTVQLFQIVYNQSITRYFLFVISDGLILIQEISIERWIRIQQSFGSGSFIEYHINEEIKTRIFSV